ncbi:MAG: 2-phospho-L-lactate guanylyltransferase [Acidimicrobiia bacterium]
MRHDLPSTGVAIPLRAFGSGKGRLADRLDHVEREHLVRTMAQRVRNAAGSLPVVVVSSDHDVTRWARSVDAELLPDPGSLDAAAAAACSWAVERDFCDLVIAHADLPHARTLTPVLRAQNTGNNTMSAVRSHRDDGTPVLRLPSTLEFRFSYGPGSFTRHRAEAHRHGLEFLQVDDPELAFDVDLPEDLDTMGSR